MLRFVCYRYVFNEIRDVSLNLEKYRKVFHVAINSSLRGSHSRSGRFGRRNNIWPTEIRTLEFPARILVAIPTALPRLRYRLVA